MALSEIIKHFEDRTVLPVDLNEIKARILALGLRHQIGFVDVELDTNIIRGYLHRYRYHEGGWDEAKYAADIYFDRNQGEDWINIVIAKELIHIMDKNFVTKKEDLDTLFRSLALQPELAAMLEWPAFALIDTLGDAMACALLIPKAARRELLPLYEAGTMSDEDIAKLAVIPQRYVQVVMSPEWDELYERLVRL